MTELYQDIIRKPSLLVVRPLKSFGMQLCKSNKYLTKHQGSTGTLLLTCPSQERVLVDDYPTPEKDGSTPEMGLDADAETIPGSPNHLGMSPQTPVVPCLKMGPVIYHEVSYDLCPSSDPKV